MELYVNLGSLACKQHKIHTSTCQYMDVNAYTSITPIDCSVRVILRDAREAVNNRGLCFVPSVCAKENRHTDKD